MNEGQPRLLAKRQSLVAKGAVLCNKPAVVEIHKGNYCADHAEAAQKMFGQGKPIYALDSTGMKPTSPAVLRLEPKRNKK